MYRKQPVSPIGNTLFHVHETHCSPKDLSKGLLMFCPEIKNKYLCALKQVNFRTHGLWDYNAA